MMFSLLHRRKWRTAVHRESLVDAVPGAERVHVQLPQSQEQQGVLALSQLLQEGARAALSITLRSGIRQAEERHWWTAQSSAAHGEDREDHTTQ